jgi:hypothetical protein
MSSGTPSVQLKLSVVDSKRYLFNSCGQESAVSSPSREQYESAASAFLPTLLNFYEKMRDGLIPDRIPTAERTQNAIRRLATWMESASISDVQLEPERSEPTLGTVLEHFVLLSINQIRYLLGISDDHVLDPSKQLRLGFPSGDPGRLDVPNFSAYTILRNAVANQRFVKTEDSIYPVTPLRGRDLNGRAELRPLTDDYSRPDEIAQRIRHMFLLSGQLSDVDADVLDALGDNFIKKATMPEDRVSISVDAILEKRGIRRRKNGRGNRGGYKPEQRAKILRSLESIENLWLELDEIVVYVQRGRSKKTIPRHIKIQSRTFVTVERKSHQRLDGYMNITDIYEITYTAGPLLSAFLFGSGKQIARLSSSTLAYDSHTEKYPKRLSRYFSSQFRIRARTAYYLHPFRVRTLVNEMGCKIDLRYPLKTKESFEKALETLVENKAIAAWQYVKDGELPSRCWIEEWLSRSVYVEPTDNDLSAYRAISEKPNRPCQTLQLFDRFMDERPLIPQTRLELAELMEVPPKDLLMFEHGKPVSSVIHNRIHRWLEVNVS